MHCSVTIECNFKLQESWIECIIDEMVTPVFGYKGWR